MLDPPQREPNGPQHTDSDEGFREDGAHADGQSDEGTAHRAAALVNDREPPSPRERWLASLGHLLGSRLYDLVLEHASADDFLAMGRKAIDDAFRSVATQLGHVAKAGSGPIAEDLLVKEIQKQLRPIADKFMLGQGKALADTLAGVVEDHPTLVVTAMLLAAAGAVIADVPIPEIPIMLRLGKDKKLSVELLAKLGTLRDISAERIGVEVNYAAGRISSKVKFERIDGSEQQKVSDQLVTGTRGVGSTGMGNFMGSAGIPLGAIDKDSPLYHVRSDILYKFHSYSNTTAKLSNESWLQNGQFVSGKISANLMTDATQRTHLDFGLQQNYGALSYGMASASATFRPNKNTSLSVGVSQTFGNGGPGFGGEISLQLHDRFTFKGHIQADGAWFGAVFRIP